MNTAITLKVGDAIRVINIATNKCHNGVVAALWPKEGAISVDVRKGKRVYFNSNMSGEWLLRDIVVPNEASRLGMASQWG